MYARLSAPNPSRARPPPIAPLPANDYPRPTPARVAAAHAYVRASNAVNRPLTRPGSVDGLIERCRVRLERDARGSGVTAWQPYVKPVTFAPGAARRYSRVTRP